MIQPISLLLFIFLSIASKCVLSQNIQSNSIGGDYNRYQHQCLHEKDYVRIDSLLSNRLEYMERNQLIPENRSITKFGFPLKKSDALDWNNFYGISGFVDQTFGPGIMEYSCNARTYDGHRGIDYFTWPFSWYLMEHDLVEVVAVADGIIIAKDDGNSSYSCSWFDNQFWNAIYVRHNDGSVAWYGHLKKNSLTSKPPGATVEKGEFLGIVGSSGISTGPHLHFEVYKMHPFIRENLVEPNFGNCNELNNGIWWENQEP
ncbi:MAG: M23 family metallopeptidase [Saprospiraceae bacterium]|nr:M23 family metallopeptidase [Saprospiraceae bacterium]